MSRYANYQHLSIEVSNKVATINRPEARNAINQRLIRELADGPTWAIRGTKRSINQILKDRVNHLLEALMALGQVTFATADHQEATKSFKEKHKPKFGAS